jgi:hypothetical protein
MILRSRLRAALKMAEVGIGPLENRVVKCVQKLLCLLLFSVEIVEISHRVLLICAHPLAAFVSVPRAELALHAGNQLLCLGTSDDLDAVLSRVVEIFLGFRSRQVVLVAVADLSNA